MNFAQLRGVAPSTVQLPVGDFVTVLDCLCARFPNIAREVWTSRMLRGLVSAVDAETLTPTSAYRPHLRVQYYREVENENIVPLPISIVYQDAHLLVADKPHFLSVIPAGTHVEDTLLARLMRLTANVALTPLHRIDRATAGLVMFSVQTQTRAAYQALFREQRINKYYEALAAPLHDIVYPFVHSSRIVRGEPFFRSQEVPGVANSTTHIDVIARTKSLWRYALCPISGKKHQLRLHMASLGAPLYNDPWYPQLQQGGADDYSRPLKLIARSLAFIDPVTGKRCRFESSQQL